MNRQLMVLALLLGCGVVAGLVIWSFPAKQEWGGYVYGLVLFAFDVSLMALSLRLTMFHGVTTESLARKTGKVFAVFGGAAKLLILGLGLYIGIVKLHFSALFLCLGAATALLAATLVSLGARSGEGRAP